MPNWISHRGVRDNNTVENTRAAFSAAVDRGFKILETDLRLTADHHIVLAHDGNFGQLSDDNRCIQKLTRLQVQSIELSDGQRPFFLDEFMSAHRDQQWVFDVKPPDAHATITVLERLVQGTMTKNDFVAKTMFVVWSKADEDFLQQKLPGAKVFAREGACWRAGLSFMYFGGMGSGVCKERVYSLAPQVHGRKLFTKDMVKKYQSQGGKVLAFLPRDEEEAQAAAEAGFDFILSDFMPRKLKNHQKSR